MLQKILYLRYLVLEALASVVWFSMFVLYAEEKLICWQYACIVFNLPALKK
jgi:hypothetical protein